MRSLTSIARNIGAETPLATSYSPLVLGLRSMKVVNILQQKERELSGLPPKFLVLLYSLLQLLVLVRTYLFSSTDMGSRAEVAT